MELISMTAFVLEQLGNEDKGGHMNYHDSLKVLSYAKFLKQPLKIEMFVPCDEEGNVLEDPLDVNCLKHGSCTCGEEAYNDCKDWKRELREAKEKVLFQGFRIENAVITNDGIGIGEALTLYPNIESLLIDFEGDITLTPSAIKQFN